MKKPSQTIIIIFLVLLLCMVSVMAILPTFTESLLKTKSLSSFYELQSYFKGTDVLIPLYRFQSDNPYTHTALDRISITKSNQYGKWDRYAVIITPTKLSDSNCFKIVIKGRKSDQTDDRDIEWTIYNRNKDYSPRENYPVGDYKWVVATFQQATTTYEVKGYIYGPTDEARIELVKNELMYIINSMQRITKTVVSQVHICV